MTDKSWSCLHIDYASPIKGTYFFCHRRQLYKMARSFQMQNAKTKTTIKVLQELFARFRLPETIVSNSGTPFTLKEFENFCELLLINHLKSAPYH